MERFKTITQQYCPFLLKNVAIERQLDFENTEHVECLNQHQCECNKGDCYNKLITNSVINKCE